MATGAERYFTTQMADPEYREAHDTAARRIRRTDELVRQLDQRRQECGLSKTALARRAGLPPEAVRRLFTADHANPTAMTLAALADALDLDLVPTPRRAPTARKQPKAAKLAGA
jgi:DNA-binding phage protein